MAEAKYLKLASFLIASALVGCTNLPSRGFESSHPPAAAQTIPCLSTKRSQRVWSMRHVIASPSRARETGQTIQALPTGSFLATYSSYDVKNADDPNQFVALNTKDTGWNQPLGFTASYVRVFPIDAYGNLIIVLIRYPNAGQVQLFYRSYASATQVWSDEEPLSDVMDASSNQNEPFVLASNNGFAVLTWESKKVIWARRFVPGQGWIDIERITPTDAFFINPVPAVNANGHVAMVFDQSDMTHSIFTREFNGTDWGDARQITAAGIAGHKNITVNEADAVFVGWSAYDAFNSVSGFRFSTYKLGDLSTVPTSSWVSNLWPAPSTYAWDFAVLPTGAVMFLWAQGKTNDSNSYVYSRLRRTDGTFESAYDFAYSGSPERQSVAITANNAGVVMAAWDRVSGSGQSQYELVGGFFNEASNWYDLKVAAGVSTGSFSFINLKVALDCANNGAISWDESFDLFPVPASTPYYVDYQ